MVIYPLNMVILPIKTNQYNGAKKEASPPESLQDAGTASCWRLVGEIAKEWGTWTIKVLGIKSLPTNIFVNVDLSWFMIDMYHDLPHLMWFIINLIFVYLVFLDIFYLDSASTTRWPKGLGLFLSGMLMGISNMHKVCHIMWYMYIQTLYAVEYIIYTIYHLCRTYIFNILHYITLYYIILYYIILYYYFTVYYIMLYYIIW